MVGDYLVPQGVGQGNHAWMGNLCRLAAGDWWLLGRAVFANRVVCVKV